MTSDTLFELPPDILNCFCFNYSTAHRTEFGPKPKLGLICVPFCPTCVKYVPLSLTDFGPTKHWDQKYVGINY